MLKCFNRNNIIILKVFVFLCLLFRLQLIDCIPDCDKTDPPYVMNGYRIFCENIGTDTDHELSTFKCNDGFEFSLGVTRVIVHTVEGKLLKPLKCQRNNML